MLLILYIQHLLLVSETHRFAAKTAEATHTLGFDSSLTCNQDAQRQISLVLHPEHHRTAHSCCVRLHSSPWRTPATTRTKLSHAPDPEACPVAARLTPRSLIFPVTTPFLMKAMS